MKITFLPSDIDGPGCYRMLYPAAELEKRGHEIFFPPYAVNDKGEICFGPFLPKADLYVMQRRLEIELAQRIIPELKKLGGAVIVEADDDDFAIPSWHKAFEVMTAAKQKVLIQMGRVANACTVSTPALQRRYTQFNPHTFLLPNCLNWEMWEPLVPVYEHRNWHRLRIGWYGAFELRQGDLREISGWLGLFLDRHPEVDFAIGGQGSEGAFDLLGVPERQRVTLPTYPFREERLPEMLQFDIGLVPLQDIAFNRAKSHLKGMEMNACGIPFVASPSESYQDWRGAGVLAKRPRDWVRALERLVADDKYRTELGRRGREIASRNTIQEHIGQWEQVYSEVVARAALRNRPHNRPAIAPSFASLYRTG